MERFDYLTGGCSSSGGDFTDLGVGLRVGNLEGIAGAHVWTQDFGSHRC